MTIIVNSRLLHPSSFLYYRKNCILPACLSITLFGHTTPLHLYIASLSGLNSKEVIRPQVPLRPPCYDFSLVADPRFDSAN